MEGPLTDYAVRGRAFEDDVRRLATLKRESASAGEQEAAELIAGRLGELGCRVRIEEEPAHGGYWWPLGIANGAVGLASLAARRGGRLSRLLAGVVGALAAAGIYDDVSGGRLWLRRALLPHRSTWNVVAETGDPDAKRTLVLIAHHDAAHSGIVFHPALPRFPADHLPKLHARSTQTLPIMYLVWIGSLLACAGAALGRRRMLSVASALSLGTVAAMADIGSRDVVPGANDNLSAVAVLFDIALSLSERPLHGLRVVLLSTGSEESFMEGMHGFARRHFHDLPRERTEFLCIECVGGPIPVVLEGEGMLRMRTYPAPMRDALADAAARLGIDVKRGLRTVAATDALIALRAGYRVAQIASVDRTWFPANYHWPTDTPDNLVWETIGKAAAVAEEFVRSR